MSRCHPAWPYRDGLFVCEASHCDAPTTHMMRRFKEGDHVRVRSEDAAVRYRKPHLRTPGTRL